MTAEPLPTEPEKPYPLRSLVASATRLTSETLKSRTSTASSDSWQNDAWEMFDLVGELRFLATTLANRMGQARFFVGRLPQDATEEPVPLEADEEPLNDVLDTVQGVQGSLGQMVTRLGINLFVPGDGWIVGVPRYLIDAAAAPAGMRSAAPPPLESVDLEDLDWRMLSVSEVSVERSGQVTLSLGTGQDEKVKVSPDDIYLIRVWRPHPRRAWEADSPTRSSLPVLRELVGLTMHISAQVDSRLAGAGVLIVPQSAQRAMRLSLGLSEDDESDPFTDALIEAMVTPISDRASASAVVPLVVTVPDDVADKFTHMTFSTPLDTAAKDMRDETIRRLALGLDANPELLLGTSGVSHWGAWLVQEDVITTHVEPPLALICDALTTQFLWPVMEAMGYSAQDAREYVIWYDVDHLIMRPNRSSDAMALYDKGVISDESLRDAAGFGDNDAPLSDAVTDPAVTLALEMMRTSPALVQNPGLPALVAQIRQVLDDPTGAGTAAPAPSEQDEQDAPETVPTPGEDDTPGDGRLPGTADDDAPTEGIGRPPVSVAAAGVPERWMPLSSDSRPLLIPRREDQ